MKKIRYLLFIIICNIFMSSVYAANASITARAQNSSVQVGDTVKVNVRIIEGNKERIQAYEGVVVSRKGGGVSETFTVRKDSYGVGVERIFPVNSPKIDKIVVVRKGKVRRAKLRFLRDKIANYRIKERNKR